MNCAAECSIISVGLFVHKFPQEAIKETSPCRGEEAQLTVCSHEQ
jgi:hypothetical protein